MSRTKETIKEVTKETTKIVLIGSIIASILFIILFVPLSQPTTNQVSYRDASILVNNINFNELKGTTGDFPNGIKINTEPSIKYPDDIFVHYNDITLSVENDNGFAKVVAAFDSNGREINYPKQVQFGDAINEVLPIAICSSVFLWVLLWVLLIVFPYFPYSFQRK